VSGIVESIAQEYMAAFPTDLQPPTEAKSNTVESIGDEMEARKNSFLYMLSTSGIYHNFKESLKPRIQRLVRERHGSRGRALNAKSSSSSNFTEGFSDAAEAMKVADDVLAEIYVTLVRECNSVLNGMYREIVVTEEVNKQEKTLYINDDEESPRQKYTRLEKLAMNAEAGAKFDYAEQFLLERIQLVNVEITLGSENISVHDAFRDLGMLLLRKSARLSPSDDDIPSLRSKAREALSVAVLAKNNEVKTHLVLSALMVEMGQEELAETRFLNCLDIELSNVGKKITLDSVDELDGYNSDDLCPADPLIYALMSGFFSQQGKPLKARKALLMATRSFKEGNHLPPVQDHGKPQRTSVLVLARASLYLFELGLVGLANSCFSVAKECDVAATEKANARNLASDTVPLIRHLLRRAEALHFKFESDATAAIKSAESAIAVCDNPSDEKLCWLLLSQLQEEYNLPPEEVCASYNRALNIGEEIPLEGILSFANLLIKSGRLEEALQVALKGCKMYTYSSSACLFAGICCLRLDRFADAEDALHEANILDNRNGEIWAYFGLLCLGLGGHRVEEAEKCLGQALRLNFDNAGILRELASACMSLGKLELAEDLIRRAISVESNSSEQGKVSAFSRKMLGDILAGQNQAATAVNEYQQVIGDEAADTNLRQRTSEDCLTLLTKLGRREEAIALKQIIDSF
jgi:tetratricopeptide (TPR) repeat protein